MNGPWPFCGSPSCLRRCSNCFQRLVSRWLRFLWDSRCSGKSEFGSWGDGLTLGQGLFLLLIAPDYFQPLRDLATAWHDRAAGFAVVADLDELDAADRIGFVGQAEPCTPLAGPISVKSEGAVARVADREVILPDFSLRQGQSIALVGPSGAGKSTTLAAIAGLAPLASG